MLYNKKSLILSSTIILLLCSSCLDFSSKEGVSQDLTPLIEKQELFEKKLNQIVKKIDGLQALVKNIPSQENNKPPSNKRKSSDPNKVHNIPQGNSYFEGDPNGKVVITEFFDFQ